MIHETIPIHGGTASLVTYIHDRSEQSDFQRHNRPAIIVLPGGAYAYLSDAEGEPVALTFLKEGFNAFVLRYSVDDACTYPEILEEVSLAVWTVRSRAAEWDIDPNAIVLMGFSAGGCLSAMSATQWNTPGLAERLGVPERGIRPDAAVIAYAAWDNANTIQRDPKYFNPGCAKIALDCTPELDFINYAGRHMPPLFIWHNRYDRYVPTTNPVMIAAKMLEFDLPFELHIFQGGEHGMSVCNALSSSGERSRRLNAENPNVAQWVPLCVNWINGLFAQAENGKESTR